MTGRTRLPSLVALLFFGACPTEPAEHDPHERIDAEHAHEDPHGEIPRSIGLPDDVVRDAGILVVPATMRVIAPTVRLAGEVVADMDRSAHVAARVEGIVEKVHVRPGDAVAQGDKLATIRAPSLQSLRAASASLKAKAASARANADRLATLIDKRMASQQEMVAATAEAQALEAEARAARERLRALGLARGNNPVSFDLRAPIAGVVVERMVVAGEPVSAESEVAIIVSTDVVWFMAHVFERDVERVEVGSRAAVQLNAHPDRTFHGEVESVSHQADPGARTLSARIPLTNDGALLRLGLFGTAQVVTGSGRDPVLTVPRSAVSELLDKSVVYVRQADGHFEVHEVVLGEADTDHVEIAHGLREGEKVVSEGAFTIKSALLRSTLGEDHH